MTGDLKQSKAVKKFAAGMLYKLRSKIDHGPLLGRRKDHDVWFYLSRLKEEVEELEEAMSKINSRNRVTRNAIIDETYDVANFAAAIAEKVQEDKLEELTLNNHAKECRLHVYPVHGEI